MPTLTNNFSFNKPLVNSATDADLWGGQLNTNWDDVDAFIPMDVSSKSADFTVFPDEYNYLFTIDASADPITATLPEASTVFNGFVLGFKAIDVTFGITIDGFGTETIDGEETIEIEENNDTVFIVCDGSNWFIRNKFEQRINGIVLQQVNLVDSSVATGNSVIPVDNSIPQNTEGVEYMSLEITPQFETSLLKIDIVFNYSQTGQQSQTTMALFQDSDADALATVARGNPNSIERLGQLNITHWMTAGTTSATTFKVRAGSDFPETLTFNGKGGSGLYGGTYSSTMTITEYSA